MRKVRRESLYGRAHISRSSPVIKSKSRMSGQEIEKALDDSLRPNVDRTARKGSNDPYWYGTNEDQWMNMTNYWEQKVSGDTVDNVKDYLLSQGFNTPDIDLVANDLSEGKRFRQQVYGVPHATSGEKVMRDVMLLSGIETAFNHLPQNVVRNMSGHEMSQATDLSAMIGNLRKYVDVQHQTGATTDLSVPVLQNLSRGVGLDVFREASSNDKLSDIIKEIKNRSNFTDDKLLMTRNREFNPKPDERLQGPNGKYFEKDYLIGGRYSNVENRLAPRHGFYDPTVPSDIKTTDLNKLRRLLLPMTKGELASNNVELLLPNRNPRTYDLERKLKFRMPQSVLTEVQQSNLINDDIMGRLQARMR